MQKAAGVDCHVTTIERYEKAADIAKKNFCEAGITDRITLLIGEAKEILPDLVLASYDMVFLDGAKGQYPLFLPMLLKLLKTGGLLVCDNVLYKGMTAEDSLKIRRKRTIVARLRKFLKMIVEDESMKTSILPIGDGVSISIKLYDKEDNR
ncbi:putative O-methyltransferase [bioreactor metagenome]|uniref:Putative O-methyltransferase n=1 Tax=bioreactor metagenome TaxID=1076179 RepID=A0A645HJK0_9ZZZZ